MNRRRSRAPRIASWILDLLLPDNVREPLLGDLDEAFHVVAEQRGLRAAQGWYWGETVRVLVTLIRPHRSQRATAPARGDGAMSTLLADVRYTIRNMARRPGFTLLACVTLALGIGATTAIFSAVNPILFRSLPYPQASRIMMGWETNADGSRDNTTFATYHDLVKRNRSFESLAELKYWQPTMTGPQEPERINGQRVSASYFHVLGVSPALGRDFQASDDVLNGPSVLILADGLWRRRFGGDRAIVGRQITINDNSYTVIGVMPAGFDNVLAPETEMWGPLQYDASLPWACRTCHHLRTVGRLRPGVSMAQAGQELNDISHALVQSYPKDYPREGFLINSLQEDVTRGVKPALLAVLGAVILVLLIACANVTNLLLARGAQRVGEFSIRAALGARRSRLIRQLITESLVLAVAGGMLGMLVAAAGIRALVALSPAGLPRVTAIGIDGSVFGFALGVTTLIGVVFGLIPALHATRRDLQTGLQRSSRRTAAGRQLTRRSLVVAEVALALVLLTGSGLMLRSLQRLFAVAPGFDAANLLTMQVQTAGLRFNNNSNTYQFFATALDAVRRLPGVTTAAFTSQLPLSGDFDGYGVHFESKPHDNPELDPSAFRYAVSPGYFETMRIPLRRGRLLDAHDVTGAPVAVVISESFANRILPGENPIGQHVKIGGTDGPWSTIVGVVGDVKQTSLAVSQSDAVYLTTTQWQFADNALSLVVRTRDNPAALAPAIRKAIWSVDRNQPILRVATMDALLGASAAARHFALILFEAFAVVALVLAGAGIYGVLSGSVTERMREIGVRSALGASRGNILGMVVRQGMTLTGIGVGIGLAGAIVASQAIVSLLFGVSRLDPVTYASVIALLAGVAALACWFPAWRAARVDPAVTLRAE